MIVTIDGIMAAGKSTYISALRDIYGALRQDIPHEQIRLFCKHQYKPQYEPNLLCTETGAMPLLTLAEYVYIWHAQQPLIFLSDFYMPLYRVYKNNPTEIGNHLALWELILETYHARLPDINFYLHVSDEVSKERRIARNHDCDSDLGQTGGLYSEPMLNFFRYLQTQVENVFIFDTEAETEAEITEKMVDIINKRTELYE